MRVIVAIGILSATSCFAAGGTCPAGVPAGVTSCFFVSAAGLDTNNGTTEGTSWLHAPTMPNCSNTCASTTITAGEGIIFRGGDTWHFGAATSPATGGTWNWGTNSWSGSSGSPIYIGVDQTWFTGGSWARPILNADNSTSTSPVGSCSHQIGTKNVLVDFTSSSWLIFDNFELTGLCQNDVNAPFANDVYLIESNGANNIYEHLYIHGWTALSFSGCNNGVGHCFNIEVFLGSNLDGDQHLQDVIDGTDSAPGSAAAMFGGGYNVSQCVFRYVSQIVITNLHLWHDTLLEHWYEPGDGQAHGNLLESSGESNHNNVVYNNVFQHICSDASACTLGIVGIWPQPAVGNTDYFFNNLMYDAPNLGGNYFNIGQNSGDQGTLTIFSNTWEQPENNPVFNFLCTNAHPFTATNNHYVDDAASPYSSGACQGTYTTNLLMTHSTATTDGYTASQTYAYSPTSAGSPTVGTGTNKQSICTTIASIDSAAGAACQSDTTYGCTYNASNHTVSCPVRTVVARPASAAWDIGAYEYAAAPPATSGYTGNGAIIANGAQIH